MFWEALRVLGSPGRKPRIPGSIPGPVGTQSPCFPAHISLPSLSVITCSSLYDFCHQNKNLRSLTLVHTSHSVLIGIFFLVASNRKPTHWRERGMAWFLWMRNQDAASGLTIPSCSDNTAIGRAETLCGGCSVCPAFLPTCGKGRDGCVDPKKENTYQEGLLVANWSQTKKQKPRSRC